MNLRLRRPILGEDCPDAVKGVAEYTLMATVSHHGKHAAGGDCKSLAVAPHTHCDNATPHLNRRRAGISQSLSLTMSVVTCVCNFAGGHYTADVLQPEGCWLRFNDAQVDVVSQEAVLSEKPYLLLYQRA
jgi:hypothetical protein